VIGAERGWVETETESWVEEIGTPMTGRPERPMTPDVARAWSEEFPPAITRWNADLYGAKVIALPTRKRPARKAA
jgi:hypothetical protein